MSARAVLRAAALAFGAAAALAVPPLAAQSPEGYDPAVLEGCLNARFLGDLDRASCIGIGAAHCLEGPTGSSNAGYGFCFGAERDHWDALLNATYQRLLSEQAQMDAENRAYNPNIPSGVETMRAMQRAWISFRDAACTWEVAQWGGGTGGGPASAQCLMELTARQTLFLEQRLSR